MNTKPLGTGPLRSPRIASLFYPLRQTQHHPRLGYRGRYPTQLMNATAYIHIGLVMLIAVVGGAWIWGVRGPEFGAVGTATFGFAFLWPQYKTERGVWMGGLVILCFSLFILGVNTALLLSAPDSNTTRSLYSSLSLIASIIVMTTFSIFVVFAIRENLRLFRRSKH